MKLPNNAPKGRIEDRTGQGYTIPTKVDRFLHLLGKAMGTRSGDIPSDEELLRDKAAYEARQRNGATFKTVPIEEIQAQMRKSGAVLNVDRRPGIDRASIDATARRHNAEAAAGKVRSTWGSQESKDYMNRGYLEKVADWVTRGL